MKATLPLFGLLPLTSQRGDRTPVFARSPDQAVSASFPSAPLAQDFWNTNI